MGPETADILKFLAFGLIWLFPVGLIVAVLSLSNADARARTDDLGPNVVPFPDRRAVPPPPAPSFLERLKRLAFRPSKG